METEVVRCCADPKVRGGRCDNCGTWIEEIVDGYAREVEPDLTGLEEHLRDSQGLGDARRCPFHPGEKTSSDDGMFDAPCRLCEGEQDDAYMAWQYDPENPRRPYCGLPTGISYLTVLFPPWNAKSCEASEDDDIPF